MNQAGSIPFKLRYHWHRLRYFEFWPASFFYIPVWVYCIFLWLKYRSISLATLANPSFYLGGLIGENKQQILNLIPATYLPNGFPIAANENVDEVKSKLLLHSITYPFIIKPQCGERGTGVEKIEVEQDLIRYFSEPKPACIVQEFISFPLELGVLWYAYPNGNCGISSVVVKSFLSITGDGKQTLQQLLKKSERAIPRLPYFEEKFKMQFHQILKEGEEVLLEPIGNHCRGTTFLSGQDLINPDLVKVFQAISQQINGFYIGRFDLKVSSIEDLYAGKNIKILELNGIASEPAHIYAPAYSLMKAWQALFTHWKMVYEIAAANQKLGYQKLGFKKLLKQLRQQETNY